MATVRSFTVRYGGLSRVLVSDVQIASAYDPATVQLGQHPPFKQYNGIWDTGATASVITQKVVDELNLQPIGMAQVRHAHGTALAEVYLVNIALPNGVAFASLRVTKGELATGEVLIGMDIIAQGDFAVTNHQKITTFTYRVPSIEMIDFTGKAKPSVLPTMPKVGRNDPCPCGSGKKFKKCCANKPQQPP